MRKQLDINFGRGGRRRGAGRKRIHSKGVAHRIRESVNHRTPMHINFKYRVTIKNKFCLKLLKRAILNARGHGLRVIHFSLQHNHVHLNAVRFMNLVIEYLRRKKENKEERVVESMLDIHSGEKNDKPALRPLALVYQV